jgi:hypothetical protein
MKVNVEFLNGPEGYVDNLPVSLEYVQLTYESMRVDFDTENGGDAKLIEDALPGFKVDTDGTIAHFDAGSCRWIFNGKEYTDVTISSCENNRDLINECLHVLNSMENPYYNYDDREKLSSSYDLAKRLAKLLILR